VLIIETAIFSAPWLLMWQTVRWMSQHIADHSVIAACEARIMLFILMNSISTHQKISLQQKQTPVYYNIITTVRYYLTWTSSGTLTMTHFLAFVLIPPDVEDIHTKIEELMAPYYEEREVEPYKEYISPEMINSLALKFKTGTDFLALLEHLKQDVGWNEVGLDEQGIYEITTFNPRPMWDYWYYSGGKYLFGETIWKECLAKNEAQHGADEPFECNSCPVADLPTEAYTFPAAIVSPDGLWYDLTDFGWKLLKGDSLDNQIANSKWQGLVRELFQKHADCLAVSVHCHC
jgi:hypothetical protein